MSHPPVPNDIRRDLVALLPRLRRFARTLTSDPSTADELVGEVCARAIQKSLHWRGKGRLESWIFTLIRSEWSHDQRNNDEPAEGVSDLRGNGTLSLAPPLACALLLADVEGFDYAEAASILGVQQDVFASRLCAARLHLAAAPVDNLERRA